ncbi:MAG: SPFH domain-containing protein [Actinomycetota bacterium]
MNPMQLAGLVLWIGMWAGLIALLVYLQRLGKPSNHTLLQYQRGIIYRLGLPFKDVGPGRHRLWVGRDYLVYVDMRPQSFTRNLAGVATRDGELAAYSLAGKFQAKNARKAINCARDHKQAAIALIASTVRRMLNDYSSEDIKSHPQEICNNIIKAVQDGADRIGMEIPELRFTQLAILKKQAAAAPSAATPAAREPR